MDGFKETYDKIRGHSYEKIRSRILELVKLRNDAKSKVKIDINMVVDKETEKLVPEFCKEWKGKVDRIQIQPIISFKKRNKANRKRCKEFWRGNVVILWDGTVTVCCVDYEGNFSLGNAKDKKMIKIWNGKKMQQLRKQQNKGKWHPICQTCTEYMNEYISPRFE